MLKARSISRELHALAIILIAFAPHRRSHGSFFFRKVIHLISMMVLRKPKIIRKMLIKTEEWIK